MNTNEALSLLAYLTGSVLSDEEVHARMVQVDSDDVVRSVPWRAYSREEGTELEREHVRWASLRDVCEALDGWSDDTRDALFRDKLTAVREATASAQAIIGACWRLSVEERGEVVRALVGGETRPSVGGDK